MIRNDALRRPVCHTNTRPMTPDPRTPPKPLAVPGRDDHLAVHDFGGDGPHALFVHATGFHGLVWRPVAVALGDRLHCWAVDLSFHGDSTGTEVDTLHWSIFGRDVLAVADWLPRPLIGVGHSLGGAAIVLAEMARPGTFDRIVLYEPAIPDSVARETLPQMITTTQRRRTSFDSQADAIENFAAKKPTSDMSLAALQAYVEHGFRTEPGGTTITIKCEPDIEAEIYLCTDAFDLHTLLQPLGCPVTLITGSESLDMHIDMVGLTSSRLDAPVRTLVGAGHFGPMQAPEDFASLLLDILASTSPSPRLTE